MEESAGCKVDIYCGLSLSAADSCAMAAALHGWSEFGLYDSWAALQSSAHHRITGSAAGCDCDRYGELLPYGVRFARCCSDGRGCAGCHNRAGL